MGELKRTARSTVKRLPQRGCYDREAIYQILDEGLICHVGFVVDAQPFVIPTIHVRVGDRVCLHGSTVSRMGQILKRGGEVCVTVTLIDGLVLARSAFHHSVVPKGTVWVPNANPDCPLRRGYEFGIGSFNNNCDAFHYWSPHSGGAHFLFGDGAVRFLSYETSNTVMQALATRAGGESVELP
jgi:prepilin-type processing-associated H-X9-DG protein